MPAVHNTASLALAVALAIAPPMMAQSAFRPAAVQFASSIVARQLGTALAPDHDVSFDVGRSVTGALIDPAPLARYGLAGASTGSRVSAMRITADRIMVVIDEPNGKRRQAVLLVDPAGKLMPVVRETSSARPAPNVANGPR